eukprot:m.22081 g.22081  ORF g.22081 m.22081 type:complete len:717 (+) comp10830_c0_seq1:86-2236(+)
MLRLFAVQRSRSFSTCRALLAKKKDEELPLDFQTMNTRRFDDAAIRASVDKKTYSALQASQAQGAPLPKEAANALAAGMMKWAMGHGATKFAHWFHPVRNACGFPAAALKKETFLDFHFGDENLLKNFEPAGFDATRLLSSETDGSSYPNGGLRDTPEASAFTGWDQNSPAFVRDSTLYIPAIFVSWNGHALDEKTPLLRSQKAVNEQGLRLLQALGQGSKAKQVVTNVGCEQEFFIIPNDLFLERPDLMMTGRTVLGCGAPRGQQTSQNYFARYPARVSAMMQDVEAELWALGMSYVVQHNEVAPSQHEFSPVFALTNVAADQNVMAMEVMDEIAAQHGLRVLWHEKPFAGINGSGKHCNWGLNTDCGANLFVPGKSSDDQARFVCFLAALLRAVHVHGDTLRCGVSVPGNDFRLGAQEAPPAIMSMYTGRNLEAHIRKVIGGGELAGYHGKTVDIAHGCPGVNPLHGGAEDRNRTAPIPFCGNRFEFRAVGSTQDIGRPMAFLNAAMAESMGVLAAAIEGGKSPRDAAADMLKAHLDVVFNGDGYSAEWEAEAKKRGLCNYKTGISALHTLASDKNKKLFADTGVFTAQELEARKEILLQEHINTLSVEARVMRNMLFQNLLPALGTDAAARSNSPRLSKALSALEAAADALDQALSRTEQGSYSSVDDEADAYQKLTRPMHDARVAADSAEAVMDHNLYPFPKYLEMLFAHHN